MGPKICPSTPCMVNRGTKPATVISAENRTALSTWSALTRISRKRSVQVKAGPASGCAMLVGSGPQKPFVRRCSRTCLSSGFR